MKVYYIKIKGNEDNFFQDIISSYGYSQYIEMIDYLKSEGIEFDSWIEQIY